MSSGATRLLPGDPSRVGRFEMVGRLGEGGMGVVYLGRGEAGELAAVKLVHPGFAADPGFRARFAREVPCAAVARTAPDQPAVAPSKASQNLSRRR